MALHLFYEIPMHFLQIQMILSLTARHIYQDRRSQASNGHPPKKWGRRYDLLRIENDFAISLLKEKTKSILHTALAVL
jgi:hypothetical protein